MANIDPVRERTVLLADITGSTALYQRLGNEEAAHRVGVCIDLMRDLVEERGGVFVSAKGDDVLATFAAADDGLATVEAILSRMPVGGLSVHAGLHHGAVLDARDDIFGDTVNLTARLAAAANSGEVLISRALADQLSPDRRTRLRALSAMMLKGRTVPVEVFSLHTDTELFVQPAAPGPCGDGPTLLVRLGERTWPVAPGQRLTFGRAEDNDLIVNERWVSRRHATVAVVQGRAELEDHSSFGSFLAFAGAPEILARRETIVVASSARLSLGISLDHPNAAPIALDLKIF